NGKNLSDLEVLACLQHYGAATRLLDFTKNVFIALWFASTSHMDKYGLLVGMRDTLGLEFMSQVEAQLPITQIINNSEGIRVWEPPHFFDRMRVQESLFLLGKS